MRPSGISAVVALLSTAVPGIACAQALHPKPSATRGDCASTTYSLVPSGPVGPWLQASQDADSDGFDPSAPAVACGPAANAMPLRCVNSSGVPAQDPSSCLGSPMSDYDASASGRRAAASLSSPLSFYSVARADLGSCQMRRFSWRSQPGSHTGGCGDFVVPSTVECVDYDTGVRVADGNCQSSSRPPSSSTVSDRSACEQPAETPTPPPSTTPPPPAGPPILIQLGTCNYTSSGGGRYACGPYENYRPGPAAPSPRDLCSGRLIAGSDNGSMEFGQTPRAGKNWSVPPVIDDVPGARCVVSWRAYGYSDSTQTGWQNAYYSGNPTGIAGGLFIGKKP